MIAKTTPRGPLSFLLRAALAALAGLLFGCQSTVGVGESATRWSSLEVGANQVGEPCRLVGVGADVRHSEVTAAYALMCGDWDQPSAYLFKAREGTSSALELAQQGWWRDRLDEFLNCQAPVSTSVLDGLPAAAMDCAFRKGNWPYQALAVRVGDNLYLGDSIPAAYPAVERAIAALVGRQAVVTLEGAAEMSQEMQRLETRLATARYTIGDLTQYRELLRRAQGHNFQSQFVDAEQRYRKALELQTEAVSDDPGALAFLYMHIALELSNQERFDEAEAFFSKADGLLPESLESADEARLISYRAIHLANQRKNQDALDTARKASDKRWELARQYGYSLGSSTPALGQLASADFSRFFARGPTVLSGRAATALGDIVQSRYVEAAMLVEQRKLDEADEALNEAMQILEGEPRVPRRWLPEIRLLQGRIAEIRGDFSQAERFLTAAIADQRTLFSESRTEGRAYVALGRVYWAQQRRSAALRAFRAGFGILGEQGGELRLDDTIPYFRAGLAEAKASPEREQEIFAELFEVGQAVRGPVAAQSMAKTAARLADSDRRVGGLIRALQDAKKQRERLGRTLTIAQADPRILPPQIEELESQLQGVNARIAALDRQVQSAAPRYNQLVDRPVSSSDALAVLRQDEAIAQILVGQEAAFGFFVDADSFVVYEIPLTEAEIEERVLALRRPFEVGDPPPAFPVEDAHQFYALLLGAVDDRLAKVKHVVTVPSGPLLSLPFGLLVTEAGATVDYSNVAWMARRNAITVAPSVQSFVNLRETITPSQATKPFIGFGDLVPSEDVGAILAAFELPESCRKEAEHIAKLGPLPNTAHELRAVFESLRVAQEKDLVLGPEFTEASLKERELASYRIVYFATHGLLPSRLQCIPEPALLTSRLSQDDTAGGFLTSSEVGEFKLDADLVVLSACDTGGGAGKTGGEALSGLARAFFFSGARSLLVTHWQIPDAPTVQLLTRAFDQMASGNLTYAEALHRAQISLIEDPKSSHPLDWAGFTVVGDGGQRLTSFNVAQAGS